MRWIRGELLKPSSGRIAVVGCARCRVVRRDGGYCLSVPTSVRRVKLQLDASGFRTCRHYLKTATRRVMWKLKVEDPDQLASSTYYACYRALP